MTSEARLKHAAPWRREDTWFRNPLLPTWSGLSQLAGNMTRESPEGRRHGTCFLLSLEKSALHKHVAQVSSASVRAAHNEHVSLAWHSAQATSRTGSTSFTPAKQFIVPFCAMVLWSLFLQVSPQMTQHSFGSGPILDDAVMAQSHQLVVTLHAILNAGRFAVCSTTRVITRHIDARH